ncbi:MAG: hypothetical protein PHP42_13475 [Bacteroidota bacterium]|nr:hypothetical protein [Bacteroidota bacterium]
MEHVLLIAQIVVLLLLSALSIYFILVLVRLREVLGTVDANLKQVSTKVLPMLDNLEFITSKLRAIVENFDEQMGTLRTSIETIRSVADNVASFERRVQDAVETPIMDVMNTIGGIIRGFSSFITRITGGSSSD